MTKLRKQIDLPSSTKFQDKLKRIALKEKRRGKDDPKNLIEDMVENYVNEYKF